MTAIIVKTRAELDAVRETVTGRTVLVPTMGALHEGHRSLIRHARSLGEHVVVSIFVNPLQFGPNEDLDRYPRTLAADVEMCTEEGVDAIFAPSATEVYPRALEVTLSAGRMGTIVEGACRPGHFDGVLTVVVKLFNLVRPDIAVFGQKDAQQLAVIRRMVSDLNLPVTVEACPTVREDDGLALSSRNRFLSAEDRTTALALSTALHCGLAAAGQGPAAVLTAAQAVLDEAVKATPPLELDYLVLVDADDFTDVPPDFAGPAVLAVAGKVGTTHLIDNLPLELL